MSQTWLLFGTRRIMCELRFETTNAEKEDIYKILIALRGMKLELSRWLAKYGYDLKLLQDSSMKTTTAKSLPLGAWLLKYDG